ncbi:MAG: hypothetical protein IJL66_05415 [Lachnospiraceae bacterium]|nr:hypothetical protein [Lachnospiraceae bacterium]
MERKEEGAIRIITDAGVSDNEIKLHIKYEKDYSLKELTDALDAVNKAINDINRDNGIGNKSIGKKYAAKVSRVESGSIVLFIVTNIVVPITLSVLANYIYDRLKRAGAKNSKNKIDQLDDPLVFLIVDGRNAEIEIHIGESEYF